MHAALPHLVAAATGSDKVTTGRFLGAVALTLFACFPIGLSLWAFLDAAKRPQWAWALSAHRQVVWLVAIPFGVLTVCGGLAISAWYLVRVRPVVAAAEHGDLGAR